MAPRPRGAHVGARSPTSSSRPASTPSTTATTSRWRPTAASGSRTPTPTRRCGRSGRACAQRGIRVGVLSNTIWTRDYHRGIFERDGVLDLARRRPLLQRDRPREAAPRGVPADLPRARRRRRGARSTSATGSSRTSTARSRSGCARSGSRTPTSRRRSASTSTAVPDAVAHELLDVLGDRRRLVVGGGGARVSDPSARASSPCSALAGFLAGWVDAVVGGGGLIQLPALLLGVPGATPAQVLATNKFGSIWGTATALGHLLPPGAARPAHGAADGRRSPTSARWWGR